MQCTVLDPKQRARIDRSEMAREQIAEFHIMNINFYPRESRLITFRDPWSFPVLFHPGCNNLIRQHLEDLAQKASQASFLQMKCNPLTRNSDRFPLRFLGRVPCDSILPATLTHSRSRSYVLPFGTLCSK